MTSPNLQTTKLLKVVRDKERLEANVCMWEERGSIQPVLTAGGFQSGSLVVAGRAEGRERAAVCY